MITNDTRSQNLLSQTRRQVELQYQLAGSAQNGSNIPPNQCTGHPQYINFGRGAILLPGYPGRYRNLQECVWIIRTKPGYFLEFSLPQNETISSVFQIEQSTNCVNDFLEISAAILKAAQLSSTADISRDAEYVSLGKFCGFQSLPFNLLQTYNELGFLRFSTNDQITMNGFKINFKSGNIILLFPENILSFKLICIKKHP